MKKAFLAASAMAALVGGTTVASADHRPPGAASDWSGPYIAASVGYGLAEVDHSLTLESDDFFDVVSSSPSADGVTGTVAIGYDRQLTPDFLLGVFADYTFGELDGSGRRVYPDDSTFRFSLEYDNVWAVGARLGYIRSEHTLLYLTAGYTEADLEYSDEFGSGDYDLKGYFLGAGLEHNIRDNLYLKLEYRFSDFGDETIFEETTSSCAADCTEREEADTHIHAIRLGVAYKFGGPREPAPAPLK
ncbi:outer membrane beta-barrel protein [Hyphomicrobium sp. CS1GBMeth3]|uniref:outer membrane protein n=1 Tax=Hyphomicrobium sp. CS1GBMeth3 TaxID=1892845 RepID=UPI0009FA750E|nr:outer membrane beta-barrel protein [Hyphomicrobium sp. CS1GBMeth3]